MTPLAVTGGELTGWASLAAGLLLSFLYSGLETGVYSVNKIRLELTAESGGRLARRLRRVLGAPGGPLGTLLIGNNLANNLSSVGIVMILTARSVAHADYVALAILTPVVFVFCEVLPKNLFHRHTERLTYFFSGFLSVSRTVFTLCGLEGLIRLLTGGVLRLAGRRPDEDDAPLGRGGGRIAGVLAEGRASGAITHTQSLIAERVVRLGRVRLADVMTPIDRAVLVTPDVTADELRRTLAEHGHPRVGVYAHDPANIVGVLNAYDVLLAEDDSAPADHMAPAVALNAQAGVIGALVALQRSRSPIGFVLDADSNCIGVVTVKDLVEEIVGELDEW